MRAIDKYLRIFKISIVFFCLLFFPLSIFISGQSQHIALAAQGLTSFEFKKDLIFNTSAGGAAVSTGQTDFPVCVHLNSSSWPNATERAHFFAPWNVDGKRAQFFDADGTMNLSYEVEYYSQADQEAVYWVKVPQVDGNSTTDKLVVAYGNDPNGSDQDDAAGVWDSDYLMVWHLNNSFNDSTSHGINGANDGTTDIAGVVGAGRHFDGVDNFISFADGLIEPTSITISCWLSNFDNTTDSPSVVRSYVEVPPFSGFSMRTVTGATDSLNLWVGSGAWAEVALPALISGETHLAYTFADGNASAFENGSFADQDSIGSANMTGGTGYLGCFPGTPVNQILRSDVDEFRISDIARSADWLKLEYYSMNKTVWNGDAWLSWGSEVNQRNSNNPSGQLPFTGD